MGLATFGNLGVGVFGAGAAVTLSVWATGRGVGSTVRVVTAI